jgi:hypothetical protein
MPALAGLPALAVCRSAPLYAQSDTPIKVENLLPEGVTFLVALRPSE